MKRRTLHDEANNEDYYYESVNGRVWHEVEREDPEDMDMEDRIAELENDIMVLVLRLLGEDESTFAPETQEVMRKWKDRALEELDNV
jgi:hypothetical protein